MKIFRSLLAFLTSLVVHLGLLGVMWYIKVEVIDKVQLAPLESVFIEKKIEQEFNQELIEDTRVSQTMNTFAGGAITTKAGSNLGPVINQKKIDTSANLPEVDVNFTPGDLTVSGDTMLGKSLGTGEIHGEIGAVVEGYGPALSRVAQEIARLMLEQPVLAVWLFDESGSMKDDQEEIAAEFHKIYEELNIIQEKTATENKRKNQVPLQTVVMSFGARYRLLTPTATTDVKRIQSAIERIPVDESGEENMCQSIRDTIRKFGTIANRSRPQQKLILIVVSDEAGDDGERVEETIKEAGRFDASIYVLGRESVFGYPTARYRWKDKRGLYHWLPTHRGPETAYRECLQWDGLHARWDADRAGFGPYEQVRLAKETGGIFFLLPGKEDNISGRRSYDQRKLEALDMKKYRPLLLARDDYAKLVTKSDFRSTLSKIVYVLDPKEDKELSIRQHHYSTSFYEFEKQGQTNFIKAATAFVKLNQALGLIEKIEPLRDTESSDRWRAHFDLIHAQCLSYRVRLFQYMLAVDEHLRDKPKVTNLKSNEWNLIRTPKMRTPDDEQYARIKKAFKLKLDREEFLAELKKQEKLATDKYQHVVKNHPGTPWQRRAEWEMNVGFGMKFVEGFRDPRYNTPVKLPKL